MSGGFYGQFLNTVGLEYESSAFTGDYVKGQIVPLWQTAMGPMANNIVVTRDASTEFMAMHMKVGTKNLLISTHTRAFKRMMNSGNTKVMGFELFTTPLEIPEFEQVIYPMLTTLSRMGDYTSRRNSVHFHIGFANNLRLLKNLLRICLSLDPVLYRLGGMGGTFRGNLNLAAYARPLLNAATVVVNPKRNSMSYNIPDNVSLPPSLRAKLQAQQQQAPSEYDGKFVQVINPLSAIEARTIDEFWAAFGVNYPSGGGAKYHPARYTGCNFFAVASHSTMEFRHFNQSLNAPLIVSVAKFLRAAVELATVMSKQEREIFDIINPNKEISMADAAKVVERIVSLCQAKDVENLPSKHDMGRILETIEDSHFETLPETPVKSHNREFYLDSATAIKGKLAIIKSPLEEQHVDIHNISEKEISIFD